MESVKLQITQAGNVEFLALCQAQRLQIQPRQRALGTFVASLTTMEIVGSTLVAIAPPLASVLVAWVNARASRTVIIQTSDGQVVHTRGMSEPETIRLLQSTVSITAIQKAKDDDPVP